ncbi:MAG: glycosyltransferase [Chitinophagaceae bacterium]|nr:MAG: glycosyltransferase [Chitinophagaceae bacterium]
MKILHIIFSMHTGGTETMLVDIVNEQAQHADVTLVIVNKEIYEPIVAKISSEVKVIRLNRLSGSRSVFPLIKLNYLIWKYKFEVLHCHTYTLSSILLPVFWSKSKLTLHNTGIESKNLSRYEKLFAISDAVALDLKLRTGLNSKVVANGVDFSSIEAKTADTMQRVTDDYRIVQVGRLDADKKGQHILIEALHLLHEQGIENIKVDFIGEGDSFLFLKNLVQQYSLQHQVRFLGLKDRSYIYTHLKDYDLLVQPSFYEGFGLTVAEGMAAKIPVLVSDIEGPMEVIGKGKYGRYFACGDAKDLAGKILETIHAQNVKEEVEKAYSYAVNKFSIKNTAHQYIKNYNS